MLKRTLLSLLAAALIGSAGTIGPVQAKSAPEPELVNLSLGKSYTLETPYQLDSLFGKTESAHPDDTGRQLTDGEYGGTTFSNPAYVGRIWQGSRIVTIDLENPATVEDIYVNFLQDNPNGIFFPLKVHFSVSLDGRKWEKLKDGRSALPTTLKGPATQKIGISGIHKQARYVKVEFPVQSWVFLDEIEVLGTPDLSGKNRIRPLRGRSKPAIRRKVPNRRAASTARCCCIPANGSMSRPTGFRSRRKI
ncbi:hypothetical protein PACILC2_48810 [Paenibacillus cisolokensis]|uniref:F5/8 type C domain-containing protein n=1 Tax=Paenibacillus cisolokensis TaxID=1658519 RepID=A0ABQ4NDJ9_9BACL|nr:discoidin domain-containing protein [Paenibacillus cisolokensis]GIQ66313.1 hypothetical protein PACILC2_48810 [Paenibacillus cisolokensis]